MPPSSRGPQPGFARRRSVEGIRHASQHGGPHTPAAGVLLATVLLTGCGGGSDADSPPKKPDPLTEADWTAAHTTYEEVGDAFNAALSGAIDYQAAVRKVHDKSPAGVLTDPAVEAALADQQALAATRDEEIARLGDEPAMSDPELKKAYDTFTAAAEEMTTFQDGYNESMPASFVRSTSAPTSSRSRSQKRSSSSPRTPTASCGSRSTTRPRHPAWSCSTTWTPPGTTGSPSTPRTGAR